MRTLLVRYGLPVVLGLFGMLAGLGLVHAYTDHQSLHAIIRLINENAQRSQNGQPQGH